MLCSGHGRCITVDSEDDVVCECDEGYAGEGCELVCPGWLEPPPPGAQECSGKGECAPNAAGDAAVCQCHAASNAYGLACEYEQSQLAVLGCEECTALNEVCVDETCACQHPFYRVADQCVEASPAAAPAAAAAALLLAALLAL